MNTLMKKVETAMIAKGWNLAMIVMSDGNSNKYGSLYFKDDMELYLNHETVKSLSVVFKVNQAA
jgi:hypothetical protein